MANPGTGAAKGPRQTPLAKKKPGRRVWRGLMIRAERFAPPTWPILLTRCSGKRAWPRSKARRAKSCLNRPIARCRPLLRGQLATNVVVSKYFYGEVNTPQREYSVRQLIHRVSRTIADWGLEDGYFASPDDAEKFYRELTWLCLHQYGAFNSPVWFNVGLFHQYGVRGSQCNWHWNPATDTVEQPENPYEYPQGSACFIQSVRTTWKTSWSSRRSEAMLFKFGSGTGTDLSTLRSHREKLSGGGKPSGPLSFMRVYDQIAAVVKSGGKTRRAAKMQSLKVWHPDIMEFIQCKAKEEKKARVLIEKRLRRQLQRRSLQLDPVSERQSFGPPDRRFHAGVPWRNKTWATHWVTDPVAGWSLAGQRARSCRKWPKGPGCCGDPACNTTRRSTAGTPARTRAGSMPRIPAPSTCSWTIRPATCPAST